jgi:hypothetical protein
LPGFSWLFRLLPGYYATAAELEWHAGRGKIPSKKRRYQHSNRVEGARPPLQAHRDGDRRGAVELAVVLCSLALLTKRRGFWYVGLLSCLAGTLVSGLLDLFMSSGH